MHNNVVAVETICLIKEVERELHEFESEKNYKDPEGRKLIEARQARLDKYTTILEKIMLSEEATNEGEF